MTTIYLIRHAEAEGNLYRIAQGQDDSILTDRGWRQVKALERRFDGVQIDAVYTSDLYRTRATASALYLPRNLTPHLVRDLREIHVGVWERRTWGEIARRWPDQMSDFSRRMDRWHMEGAETPAQVLERALGAVQKIAAENGGKTVAVFSHGYVIRLLLANLQGVSLRDTGDKSPTGDNTAVSLLEWDGETLRVVRQNDNSHLLTPEYLSGEKVRRRASGLEPGLYFAPLRLPEQETLAAELTAASWEGTGYWKAMLKSSFPPTRVESVPRRPLPGGGSGGRAGGTGPVRSGGGGNRPALCPAGLQKAGLRRAADRTGGVPLAPSGGGASNSCPAGGLRRGGVLRGLRVCPRGGGRGGPPALGEEHRL